jgi:hypothetical protein
MQIYSHDWKKFLFNECKKYVNLDCYLSEYVSKLISNGTSCRSNLTDIEDRQIWQDELNCVLNTDYLSEKCVILESTKLEIDYAETVCKISQYNAFMSKKLIENLDRLEFSKFFISSLDSDLFKNYIDSKFILNEFSKCNEQLIEIQFAYLFMCAMFERNLGDILFSLSNYNSAKIPFLLKDLVNDPKLVDFFGSSLMCLVKVLFYTPKSLNLRNLSWHGFLNPSEYSINYLVYLICLIATIDFKLTFSHLKLKPRVKISLSDSCQHIQTVHLANRKLLENFPKDFLSECYNIISNCTLIDDTRRPIWNCVYSAFSSGKQQRQKFQNFKMINLMLPQLEHLLRKLYSLTNNTQCFYSDQEKKFKVKFVENYVCQIAFKDEFYLTMDDLLNYKIIQDKFKKASDSKLNAENNKLIEFLDDRLIFLINDLLAFEESPRLRDYISHGQLDASYISDYYMNLLLFICMRVAFACIEIGVDTKIDSRGIQNFCAYSMHVYNEYEANFHPINCLMADFFTYLQAAYDFKSRIVDSNFDEKFKESLLQEECPVIENFELMKFNENFMSSWAIEKMSLGEKAIECDDCISKLKALWKFQDLKSLIYRYECIEDFNFKGKELQLINLIRNILLNLKALILNLIQFGHKYSSENLSSLRERQRSNLKRFSLLIKYFDLFFTTSNYLFIFIINYCLINIDINSDKQIKKGNSLKLIDANAFYTNDKQNSKSKNDTKFEQLIKFLRQYLQLVQNLNTESESNRWHECEQLLINNHKFNLHHRLRCIMENVFFIQISE